jgi:hypothetical protein
MNEILAQGTDWLTWMEQFERDDRLASAPVVPVRSPLRPSQPDAWEQTDRLLQFPPRQQISGPHADWNRTRWLKKHDVHTQFVDAGIGACWMAHCGDDEPVCGETENAAIAKLAREHGLRWNDV